MRDLKKENAINDFMNNIKKSWTYEKLTEKEKQRFKHCVDSAEQQNAITGTYKQRWETLHAIYYTFLIALGYENHTWRKSA